MQKFAHDAVVPYKEATQSKKEQVATMFDDIAPKYDLLNRILSLGIDRMWRKKGLAHLQGSKPKHILDMATGTADVAIEAAKLLKPEQIVGVDISKEMLALGEKKVEEQQLDKIIHLQVGDSTALTFVDNSFDAITVAFGVRNFEDLQKGLTELNRVLKPAGKVVIIEFSKPTAALVKPFYKLYMKYVAGKIGKAISKNAVAYQYLDDSIDAFPEGKTFLRVLEQAGFSHTLQQKLTFGICSVYTGIK